MTLRRRLFLPDCSHTCRLGEFLGSEARAGDVLLLSGALGAGKTAFARGFIQSARNDRTLEVTSPTYLLANSYPPMKREDSTPTVVHMDLWRLEDATKRPIVDFETVFADCSALIEWPDRLGSLTPDERLEVLLEYPDVEGPLNEEDPWGFGSGEIDDVGSARDGRFATLRAYGCKWEERVEQLYTKCIREDHKGRMVLSRR